MPKSKIAITLEESILARLDALVRAGSFANRSQAIEAAIGEKLDRLEGGRLARECAKLDRREERTLADEGLPLDLPEWPEY